MPDVPTAPIIAHTLPPLAVTAPVTIDASHSITVNATTLYSPAVVVHTTAVVVHITALVGPRLLSSSAILFASQALDVVPGARHATLLRLGRTRHQRHGECTHEPRLLQHLTASRLKVAHDEGMPDTEPAKIRKLL